MWNFVKFLSYLTVQQGKNRDIKVNKKRVFLWLGGRMCLNAVNSHSKQQYPLVQCSAFETNVLNLNGRLSLLSLALSLVSVEPKSPSSLVHGRQPSLTAFPRPRARLRRPARPLAS